MEPADHRNARLIRERALIEEARAEVRDGLTMDPAEVETWLDGLDSDDDMPLRDIVARYPVRTKTMRVTIDKPIEAGKLPPEIRGTLAKEAVVRVSYEVVLTENGLTPEEEEEVLRASEEVKRGKNTYGPFDTAEDMIASLHAQCGKLDDE